MKKLKNSKAIIACCALLLLNVVTVIAQDSTMTLPQKKDVAASKNALQAKRISKELKKEVASFADATGCSVLVYMYVERAREDEEESSLFDVVGFIKKSALKNSTRFFKGAALQDSVNSFKETPKILIKVAWELDASGKYAVSIAAMVNGATGYIFSDNAMDAFLQEVTSYEENPAVDSVKNTKVDVRILAALDKLKASVYFLGYKTADVKVATKAAIKDANDSQGDTASACNICVRSAIWNVATSSVLFPNHGAFIGNQLSSYLYGRISEFDPRFPGSTSYIGNTNSIAASLEAKNIVPEFIAIPNMSGSTIPNFKQLQAWANAGQIIVGVLKRDKESGHIVMIAPHSLDVENDTIYDYRDILGSKVKYLMPKILECGEGRRDEAQTLQAGVGSAKIKDMKWYKMVGIYTSPQSEIK
jgi:hypothetical protein